MKIAMIGETRMPVLPYGGGGLGRATHEIATGLLELGHAVTLYALPGSEFTGDLRYLPHLPNMVGEFDVLIDYSHAHEFSRSVPNALNMLGDRECAFMPHNAVVETKYMQGFYPASRIIPQGCKVDDIPFSTWHLSYLVYMGANVGHKQPHIAQEIANLSGREIIFIGPGFSEVTEEQKWLTLGRAAGLICPYTIDASPRAPLEAAACGTPTLCFALDGTHEHVKDGITGFVCRGVADMVECVNSLETLDPARMRAWVKETHDHHQSIQEIEKQLLLVVNGERW